MTANAASLVGAMSSLSTRGLINPLTRYDHIKIDFPASVYPRQLLQTSFKPESRPDCGEKSYVGHGRLAGRHALVTGGDSGIGRAVVIALAREGAQVVINYLPEEEPDAEDLAEFLKKDDRIEHKKLIRIPGDLRSRDFCAELVFKAHYQMGALDLIVSNAGWSPPFKPSVEFTAEEWEDIFKVNVSAGFYVAQAAVPFLAPGASIVYTVSTAAVVSQAEIVPYSATKGALRTLISGLSAELITKGIRVNGVAPGFTYTPLIANAGIDAEAAQQLIEVYEPEGRFQQPAELAPVYVTLSDEQASYVTGSIYGTHGGTFGAY